MLTNLKMAKNTSGQERVKEIFWIAAIGVFAISIVEGMNTGLTIKMLEDYYNDKPDQPKQSTSKLLIMYGCRCGGIISGAVVGTISLEYLGSRNSILLVISFSLTNWLSIIGTSCKYRLFVTLFLSQAVNTLSISILPVYMGRISPTEKRGSLVGAMLPGIAFGVFVVRGFNLVLNSPPMIIMQVSLGCSSILLFALLKNTPYYFVSVGDIPAAESSISSYFPRINVEDKLTEIKLSMGDRAFNAGRSFCERLQKKLKELSKPATRKSILLTVIFFTFPRLSGASVTFLYVINRYEGTRAKFMDAKESYICGTFLSVTCCLLIVRCIDDFGRKIGYILSSISLVFILTGLAIFYTLEQSNIDLSKWQWIPFALIQCYLLCLFFGHVLAPYIILSELPPSHVQIICVFVACICHGCLRIIMEVFYRLLLLSAPTNIVYICCFHGVIAAFGIPLGLLLLPETKNKTLLRIQTEIFNKV